MCRLLTVRKKIQLFLGLALFLNDTNSTDARSAGLAITLSLVIVAINIWFVVRVVRSLKSYSAYGGALRRGATVARRGAAIARHRLTVARRRLTGQLQTTTQVNVPNPVARMEAAKQVVEMRAVKRPAQPGPPLRPEMAPRLRT